jgi:hypothetical protein
MAVDVEVIVCRGDCAAMPQVHARKTAAAQAFFM